MHFGKPPCSRCAKPKKPLDEVGQTAISLWSVLDTHDRQYTPMEGKPLYLETGVIRGIVQDYGMSQEMAELIALVDEVVIPIRRRKIEKNADMGGRNKKRK